MENSQEIGICFSPEELKELKQKLANAMGIGVYDVAYLPRFKAAAQRVEIDGELDLAWEIGALSSVGGDMALGDTTLGMMFEELIPDFQNGNLTQEEAEEIVEKLNNPAFQEKIMSGLLMIEVARKAVSNVLGDSGSSFADYERRYCPRGY